MRMRVIVATAIVGLGVASVVHLSQSASAETNGTISGRITDAADVPLGGVTVGIWGASAGGSTAPLVSTVTKSDGSYSLDVRADRYRVCAGGIVADSFDRRRTTSDKEYVGGCLGGQHATSATASGTTLEVEAGHTTSRANILLDEPGRISGKVRERGGDPVRDVLVTARLSPEGTAIAQATTDEDGRYIIPLLDPTRDPAAYCVTFNARGEAGQADPAYSTAVWGGGSCHKHSRPVKGADPGKTRAGINGVLRAKSPVTKIYTPYFVNTPKVGWRMEARPGTWGPADVTLSYEWLADGKRVGTGTSYVPSVAQLGTKITLRATASAPGHAPATRSWSKPGTVVKGSFWFSRSLRLTGSPTVGRSLAPREFTALPETSDVTYRWLRDGVRIKGAKGSVYQMKDADRGHRISLRISYALKGYQTAHRTSDETETVGR